MESLLEGLAGLAEPFVELLFELIEDGLFCEAFSSTAGSKARDEMSLGAAVRFAQVRSSEDYR
jgi:hypothetical protein